MDYFETDNAGELLAQLVKAYCFYKYGSCDDNDIEKFVKIWLIINDTI